ncbi:hypothetical protein ACFQV2_25415 [Actinokineospora soli]|uniref:histidine kinase n=1 Tax=Actinokineospora soli TaxID=1048753 RepID=A0ABW2TST8_9PSEU
MALTGELRIGLFVVARLAAKHGIRVTLRESAYGGVRAVVLLPTSLLATDKPAVAPEPAAEPPVPAPVPHQHPLPPLPTRVRQDSIAPQLRDEPQRPADTGRVERSGAALAAFQRGTAQARSEADAANAGHG